MKKHIIILMLLITSTINADDDLKSLMAELQGLSGANAIGTGTGPKIDAKDSVSLIVQRAFNAPSTIEIFTSVHPLKESKMIGTITELSVPKNLDFYGDAPFEITASTDNYTGIIYQIEGSPTYTFVQKNSGTSLTIENRFYVRDDKEKLKAGEYTLKVALAQGMFGNLTHGKFNTVTFNYSGKRAERE